MLIVLQVLCACTLAYVLSLSLALSLTSIARRQCHHTHQSIAPVQTASCLTTETACRFHRPAATHRRGKDEASVSAKRAREPRNDPGRQCKLIQLSPNRSQLYKPWILRQDSDRRKVKAILPSLTGGNPFHTDQRWQCTNLEVLPSS